MMRGIRYLVAAALVVQLSVGGIWSNSDGELQPRPRVELYRYCLPVLAGETILFSSLFLESETAKLRIGEGMVKAVIIGEFGLSGNIHAIPVYLPMGGSASQVAPADGTLLVTVGFPITIRIIR